MTEAFKSPSDALEQICLLLLQTCNVHGASNGLETIIKLNAIFINTWGEDGRKKQLFEYISASVEQLLPARDREIPPG